MRVHSSDMVAVEPGEALWELLRFRDGGFTWTSAISWGELVRLVTT